MGAALYQVDGRADWQTDRQTDMTKLIVAFRNFANAPKNCLPFNTELKHSVCRTYFYHLFHSSSYISCCFFNVRSDNVDSEIYDRNSKENLFSCSIYLRNIIIPFVEAIGRPKNQGLDLKSNKCTHKVTMGRIQICTCRTFLRWWDGQMI